jgi:hypothetical protein
VGIEATRDRLVVAGGQTGTVFVYSLTGGRLVRRFSTGSGGLVKRAFASSPRSPWRVGGFWW